MKNASISLVIPTLGKSNLLLSKTIPSLIKASRDIDDQVSVKVVANVLISTLVSSKLSDFNEQLPINVIQLPSNLGFAGATNAGIRASSSDYIVTLNDDAWVETDFLSELIKTQRATGADMVASTIYRGETEEIDSCGFEFAWRGKAVAMRPEEENSWKILNQVQDDKLGATAINQSPQVRGSHAPYDASRNLQQGIKLISSLDNQADNWRQNLDLLPEIKSEHHQDILDHKVPFGPDAAAALYTRKLFNTIGLFNDNYFAYLEDVDLALRARRAGLCCAWAFGAVAHHQKHATSSTMGGFKQSQDVKNWWRLVLGSYPKAAWTRFGSQILFERARNFKGLIAP